MESKTVYWHLPGFCEHLKLYIPLLKMINNHPERLKDGYKIGSIYGSFPSAIWNGGRCTFGMHSSGDMKQIISIYNNMGIPLRFTWTNQLIEEKHLFDTYCNIIMDIANNGMNQCIVYSPIMEDYIRKNYPDYKIISSTTKLLNTIDDLEAELNKDYFLVVLHGDFNHDSDVLKYFSKYSDKIEIMANESCIPHCPNKADHYYQLSKDQITFHYSDFYDKCPIPKYKSSIRFLKDGNIEPYAYINNQFLSYVYSGPMFLYTDEIDKLVDMGYHNFKIVGREKNTRNILDTIIYFLIKDEFKLMVFNELKDVFE